MVKKITMESTAAEDYSSDSGKKLFSYEICLQVIATGI